MFWGFFTVLGPGSLIPIEGMMNSDKYKDILANYLLPILSDNDFRARRVFQQDLASCNTSKKMQTFFAQTDINLLDWPGNSPDLNPIENLRAIIKRKLSKYDCSTKTSLIEAIIRIWYHDEELKKMCCNLVHSTPKRVSMIIKSKGGHIKY